MMYFFIPKRYFQKSPGRSFSRPGLSGRFRGRGAAFPGRRAVCEKITVFIILTLLSTLQVACERELPLGEHEALRVYTEFTDGKNRGLYDPQSGDKGFPDEDYDATTAMVINVHRLPGEYPDRDSRLRYRKIHPETSAWKMARGETLEFWYRSETIQRIILKELDPGSVYEFQVTRDGNIYRFATMPSSLDDREVTMVMTGDHQSPGWSEIAHQNAKLAALLEPDLFVVAGDFVNDEGRVTEENAGRWATYLDMLYGTDGGYFIIDRQLDGQIFSNMIIPHTGVVGNHEMGDQHHLRWPTCVNTGSREPGYPQMVAANWMEQLFHWPFRSEGFFSELRPDHPNMNPEFVMEGYGQGGFGALRFSDYLLLIALDNSQNWEAIPDNGLRDWRGVPLTEQWPWFEDHHGDVRQDVWLRNLLEPDNGPAAGDMFTHIIPFWHRGLFGSVRLNMSLKNRNILSAWLPVLHRNGVRLIKEGHDHNYTRTVAMRVSDEPPAGVRADRVRYEPASWELPDHLPDQYLDDFFSVNVLRDKESGEIVGWEHEGNYLYADPAGMRAVGHGGWAAGRRPPGARGGGNAGWWFVDADLGGDTFSGPESYHMTFVRLSSRYLTVESWHPDQVPLMEQEQGGMPFYRFRWDHLDREWLYYDFKDNRWKQEIGGRATNFFGSS